MAKRRRPYRDSYSWSFDGQTQYTGPEYPSPKPAPEPLPEPPKPVPAPTGYSNAYSVGYA